MTLPFFKYNRCLAWHSAIVSSASVIGRDCLSVRGRSVRRWQRWSHTLRQSMPMTDAADVLFSHVIMSSLLVMALFMAEDTIKLRHARQRLYLIEGKVIFIYKHLCLCFLVTWRRELKLSRQRKRERRKGSRKTPKI